MPVNTRVMLVVGAPQAQAILRKRFGAPIPTLVETTGDVVLLTPEAELEPDSEYEVVLSSKVLVGSFFTGSHVDDVAPLVTAVKLTEGTGSTCTSTIGGIRIAIEASDDDTPAEELVVELRASGKTSALTHNVPQLLVADDVKACSISLPGSASGTDETLEVIVYDRAGNASAVTTANLTFPTHEEQEEIANAAKDGGCTASSEPPQKTPVGVALLLGLGGVVVARRRRV